MHRSSKAENDSSLYPFSRNSLSNYPCPLSRARGRGRSILLARAIDNKPFQCSDGCNSPQRRRTAVRVEQGEMFKFYVVRAVASGVGVGESTLFRHLRRPGAGPVEILAGPAAYVALLNQSRILCINEFSINQESSPLMRSSTRARVFQRATSCHYVTMILDSKH